MLTYKLSLLSELFRCSLGLGTRKPLPVCKPCTWAEKCCGRHQVGPLRWEQAGLIQTPVLFPSWHSESGTRPGRLLPSSWAVTTFHVLRKQNLTLLLTPWFCVFVPCQCQRGRKDTCRQWHWPVLCSLPQQQHWHTEVTLDLRKQQNWCHQRVFVAGLGHLHSGWLRDMKQWDRPWELLVCPSPQLV